MSQNTDVLDYIKKRGSITARQAFDDLGIMRLSARIGDLKSCGIPVEREMVSVLNRNGERCRVARYTIPVVIP